MKPLGILSAGLGATLMVAATINGGVDLARASRDWSSYGPLTSGGVPTFDVALVGGDRFETEDLIGRVSVVTFWATWCGVCMTELPMFEALHEERTSDEVQVVLINREGRGVSLADARYKVTRTAQQRGLQMPLGLDDGSMYRAFRADFLPHTVVVDRRGAIRHVHPGRVLKSTLDSEVAELLKER